MSIRHSSRLPKIQSNEERASRRIATRKTTPNIGHDTSAEGVTPSATPVSTTQSKLIIASGMLKSEAVMEDKEMKFDLVSNPHPHPLIYYRQGKPDGQNICCYKCNKEFCPPAFACSDDSCNFNIHQSCMDLPYKIRSPFHNHVLEKSKGNNFPCTCCNQNQYGDSYICTEKCGFSMDVQCAMANPKAIGLLKTARGGELRHFSHPHPLILHQDTDPERRVSVSICRVCECPITSTSSYYFCSRFLPQCLSNTFHKECAELPRQKLYPELHRGHPLVLLARNSFRSICVCCETECTGFFYSCHACKFNLHVDCVSSFGHKHDFRRLPYKITFKCKICHISNNAHPWLCKVCHLLVHKECAISKMSEDEFHSSSTQDYDFNLNQLGNRIKHFSHKQHELTLCRPHEDMLCHGCMRHIPAMSRSYGCPPCGFYLHKQCATLPTEHINSVLHPHVLSLVYIPDSVFSCVICLQYCHGFAYRCEKCYYVIDIRCATTTLPFKHPSHKHPLTYYDGSNEHACKACGVKNLKIKKVIGCMDCQFYLHAKCARLPLAMINRFDKHPLILTFENHKENETAMINRFDNHPLMLTSEEEENETAMTNRFDNHTDESEEEENENVEYCDVCEEKRYVNEWFYDCRICCFSAHTKCIVGDYPFLKSAKFKNHLHPLNLVNECMKKRHSSRWCDACGDSLDGKLALECENSHCNFNMHAFGQCYHKQLSQSQITFTMPSLRYRSISLHSDQMWKSTSSYTMKEKLLLEKDKCPTALSFLSQGNWRGKHWDDGVHSSIRSLTIFVTPYLGMGIQIEYEDKYGNSIWTDKHGYHDNYWQPKVVKLNHPDEYLTSLHGWYDMDGIHSLSFETNQRTLGPYGKVIASTDEYELIKFPASTETLKIVGLHGWSIDDGNLTAIGFHFIEI